MEATEPEGAEGRGLSQRTGPDEGVLESALGVITRPVVTLHRLSQERRLAWAVGLTVILSLLSALAITAQFGSAPMGFRPGPPPMPLAQLRPVLLVAAAILGPVFGLLLLAINAALVHGTSLLLRGRGSYAGLFVGLAFAGVPSFFNIPFQLLPLAFERAGGAISLLVSLAVGIWVLVLDVIAIRQNYGFSTGRAVAALLIPVLVVIGLLVALIVLVFVLVVASLG
ncbi:MAG: YIP1 family protein [Actinomycetota bacterium]|nr:YIP1 family protein [Actinomycetota bacterium]